MESKVSSSASAKTIIAFEGSSVTGIEVNGVYDKNTVVNMAANGNGTDTRIRKDRDTRWVPEELEMGKLLQRVPGNKIPRTLQTDIEQSR